jgi:transposase
MLRMDQVHVVRHKHFIEGRGIREIARATGIDRKTVRKYLKESEPRREERVPRRRPVLEVVGPRIDELLEEWVPRSTRKHRITSPRVHRQLVEEGYTVAERTVRGYLAEKRREGAEVYIPLVHRPGDEAQVDFFAVTVEEDGDQREAWKFLMRLMYSGRDFVHIYDRCDQVSFLDGHVRAFSYIGGVTRRVIYDNLSAAVKRVVKLSERELTDRFRALCSHYLFEPCFARVREGHDKGGVEGRGRGIRWQHMTPIVEGRDLDEISEKVLADVELTYRSKRRRDGTRLEDQFAEEQGALLPLPAVAFEAREVRPVAISRSSTVTVYGAQYSLPSRWARLDAMAHVGATDIRFVCRGEALVIRRKARGEKEIRYRHYLRELSRKPNAVRQVVPELISELGEPYGRLWSLLEETHGPKKGARILSGILGAMEDHSEECVTAALEQALRHGRCDLVALHRHLPSPPVLRDLAIPASLRSFEIEAGRAADYDALLVGGAR